MHITSLINLWRTVVALLACRLCGGTDGPFTFDGRCETCADGAA